MDKYDVIRFFDRLPDKILDKNQASRLISKKWKCSKCSKEYNSVEPIPNPAPCICGSIFFEKL